MAGVGGARGSDLVRPGVLDADAAVGGHEVGVRPLGPVGVAARAGRGALEVDEPAVAPADGLQEPGEVACGPVCHGAQCAPPVDEGVRGVSAVSGAEHGDPSLLEVSRVNHPHEPPRPGRILPWEKMLPSMVGTCWWC